MATPTDAQFIQQRLGYSFNDEEVLLLALTAAGKGGTEDGVVKQGNSRLAHFGNYLMQFILAWVGFSSHRSREEMNALCARLTSSDHCAKVAEKVELNRCLKYDVRSGSKSAVVLRKALNATIAAVFMDSRDLDTVLQVALNIGLFGHDECGIDPRLLSNDQADTIENFSSVTRRTGVRDVNAESASEIDLALAGQRKEGWPDFGLSYMPGLLIDLPDDTTGLYGDCCTNTASVPEAEPSLTVVGNSKRRRLMSTKHGVQRVDNNIASEAATGLRQYLEEERDRCISHSIKPPEETFFTEAIEKELRDIGKKHASTCLLVQVLIASPCAFLTLRELVTSSKAGDDSNLWQVDSNVPAQARLDIIRHLDGKIAAYGILRRYHILHLFQESVPAESRVLTNFIHTNSMDFQRAKRLGNPANNAKSDVTQEMMKVIYPGLHPSSGEYKAKHRAISKLRVLGQRYYAMAERFHRGILGLLPICGLANSLDLGISDNMILGLPDTTFNELLAVLDRTQGNLIRRFSEAAMRVIGPLMKGTPQSSEQFQIATYKSEDIMQYPKGAEELLNILL
ncbi:hypothetical protein BJX64DRAFT_288007 [Aspergillus heterothallicus]